MTKPYGGSRAALRPDGNDHIRDQMDAVFPSILEHGLKDAADAAAGRRPESTAAGRVINRFRSRLASEIKDCYEDFRDLPPDAYHTFLFNELGAMIRHCRRALRRKDATPEELATIIVEMKAAMKEQRMVADSIAAYNASKERSAAMAGRKEKHSMIDQIREISRQNRDDLSEQDEDEEDGPVVDDSDD